MIRLGMGEISSFIDRCAFLPSDQPMILPETIASLLLCAKNLPDFIWRPCSSDTVGSPVIFPSCFFEELKNLPSKKGGNVIVSSLFICAVERQLLYFALYCKISRKMRNLKYMAKFALRFNECWLRK